MQDRLTCRVDPRRRDEPAHGGNTCPTGTPLGPWRARTTASGRRRSARSRFFSHHKQLTGNSRPSSTSTARYGRSRGRRGHGCQPRRPCPRSTGARRAPVAFHGNEHPAELVDRELARMDRPGIGELRRGEDAPALEPGGRSVGDERGDRGPSVAPSRVLTGRRVGRDRLGLPRHRTPRSDRGGPGEEVVVAGGDGTVVQARAPKVRRIAGDRVGDGGRRGAGCEHHGVVAKSKSPGTRSRLVTGRGPRAPGAPRTPGQFCHPSASPKAPPESCQPPLCRRSQRAISTSSSDSP